MINHIIRLVDVYDNIHRCLDTYHVWWYTGGNDKRKVRIIRREDKEMNEYYDAIIVGTGAAGLYCALNLPSRMKVLMITTILKTPCVQAITKTTKKP